MPAAELVTAGPDRCGASVPIHARWEALHRLLLHTSPETEAPAASPDSRTPSSLDADLSFGAKTGVAVGVVLFVVALVALGLATTEKRWKANKAEGDGELPR
ncbi:hypothetical protein PspLS_03315 [Pyricularia sp. CBS 133598]|nr:hypothetical protein PspLS_03315 [Pyricularia sp. CBS 133598]